MRQIFEYTFDAFTPDIRWWRAPISGTIQDPYRRIILYESLEKAETFIARNRYSNKMRLEKYCKFV